MNILLFFVELVQQSTPTRGTVLASPTGVQDGGAEQDDQQPAQKKQRTGPEPGIEIN
jgi:hypothetical protein